jgi:hypothetical protein
LLFNSDLDLSSVTNRLDYHLKAAKHKRAIVSDSEQVVKPKTAPYAKYVIYAEIALLIALIVWLGLKLIKLTN